MTPLVSPGGGVHRHLDDVYYGGGEWLLLTAMLGLAEPEHGEERLEWIAAHAAPDGGLPEQSQDHLLHPDQYERLGGQVGAAALAAPLVARDVPDARRRAPRGLSCPPGCS